MKRFSVLLVVVVFLMPLVVYGLSGNFNFEANDRGLMPDSSLNVLQRTQLQKTQDEPNFISQNLAIEQEESEEPPIPPDIINHEPKEEIFPTPSGSKGIIDKIDAERNIIYLKDVSYVDPRTNMEATDDFQIRLHAVTAFYHDALPVPDFFHLTEGMEIICQGRINYASKIMDFTNVVYSGVYYSLESYDYLHFSGPVQEIDWDNNQLIVSAKVFPYQAVGDPFVIRLSPSTMTWIRNLDEKQAIQIQNGIIPEDFAKHMIVEGSAELFYGNDFCTAVDITFVLFGN